MFLSSAYIFQNQCVCCCCFFFVLFFFWGGVRKIKSGISVVCQAVWIQIMPVRPDLGPNFFAKVISR